MYLKYGVTAVLFHATQAITEISVLTFSRSKKRFLFVQWASKWQNKTAGGGLARRKLHRIGINNGDVTVGRRTTERQDNGLLSRFSVLTAEPPSLSLLLSGDFLFLFYRTISSTATKQKIWGWTGFLRIDKTFVLFLEGHTNEKKLQSNATIRR